MFCSQHKEVLNKVHLYFEVTIQAIQPRNHLNMQIVAVLTHDF